MRSRSSVPEVRAGGLPLSPIQLSAALHALATGIALAVLLWPERGSEPIDFELVEQARQSTSVSPPVAPEKPRLEPRKRRGVFGASRKSITSDAPDAEKVKAGNTVAKKRDDTRLSSSDADSLPIPADEFMVSEMPSLAEEVRVPYPAAARAKGVQGAVVMDLLVDAEGRVRDARRVSGPGSGLDEAALEAVRSFRFKPARIQDKAVAVRIRYAYRFVLER